MSSQTVNILVRRVICSDLVRTSRYRLKLLLRRHLQVYFPPLLGPLLRTLLQLTGPEALGWGIGQGYRPVEVIIACEPEWTADETQHRRGRY